MSEESRTIRVLVVGCGNMGGSHARAYHDSPGFEICGLVSRGRSKVLAALANRFFWLLAANINEEFDIDTTAGKVTTLLIRHPRNQQVKRVDRPEGEKGADNWYRLI